MDLITQKQILEWIGFLEKRIKKLEKEPHCPKTLSGKHIWESNPSFSGLRICVCCGLVNDVNRVNDEK